MKIRLRTSLNHLNGFIKKRCERFLPGSVNSISLIFHFDKKNDNDKKYYLFNIVICSVVELIAVKKARTKTYQCFFTSDKDGRDRHRFW